MPKIHSRYDLPPSPSTGVGKESLTHQECKRECDINFLVKRYCETGNWGVGDGRLPMDSSLVNFDGDFQSIMDSMIATRAEFDALPSNIRDRFANDPARLISFLADSNNRDEAVKLGLIDRVRDPEPQAAPNVAAVAESGTREA